MSRTHLLLPWLLPCLPWLVACGAAGAAAVPTPPAPALAAVCASPALDVDVAACRTAVPGDFGRAAAHPAAWPPGSETGEPFAGRLRCANGLPPELRPLERMDGLLRWAVACGGEPPFVLYVAARRCGLPCPPAGLDLVPAEVEAYLRLARTALAGEPGRAQVDEALAWLERALQRRPDDGVALQLQALALMQRQKPAAALAVVRRLRQLDPGEPQWRWQEAGVALAAAHEAEGEGTPAPKGPAPQPVRPPPAPVAAKVRHVRLDAADVAWLEQLGQRTGTPAIEAGDVKGPVALPACSRLPWLCPALRTDVQLELLRQVARSGEPRTETWLELHLGDQGLADVFIARHPDGLVRAVLRDPATGFDQLDADLDAHVATLPPDWAFERVRGALSVPVLVVELGGVLRLAGLEPDLGVDDTLRLATLGWGGHEARRLYAEFVNVLRMIRAVGDPGRGAAAAAFLTRFAADVDRVLEPLRADPGRELAVHRAPVMYKVAQSLQVLADRARAALGRPPTAPLPVPPLDAPTPVWPPTPAPTLQARQDP